MTENFQEQVQELESIGSILTCGIQEEGIAPEFFYEEISLPDQQNIGLKADSQVFLYRGQFRIDISLTKALKICLTLNNVTKNAELRHMPPLYVNFLLSSEYPSDVPPLFHFASVWLDPNICSKLHQETTRICMENAGMAVLFAVIQEIQDFLPSIFPSEINLDSFRPAQDTIAKTFLAASKDRTSAKTSIAEATASTTPRAHSLLRSRQKSSESSHVSSTKPAGLTKEQLFALFVDYDQLGARRDFESQWFTCEVCFEQKKGKECLKFIPCDHVFCLQCIGGYFAVQIKEGAVQSLLCLSGKCQSQANPQQVREAVQNDVLYERYDSLLLSQTLDLMSDIVPCPRPSCQQPVLLEKDSKGEQLLPIASCVVCSMNFCTYCRKVYHGISECTFTERDSAKLYSEYESAPEEKRRRMEQRYGKQTLRRLIDNKLAQEWITANSRNCPHCRAPIEKQDGCNKMWCRKCGSYFCWLCLQVLSKQDPYNHFNNPKAPCYNKLFFGVQINDGEEEVWDDDFDSEGDDGDDEILIRFR